MPSLLIEQSTAADNYLDPWPQFYEVNSGYFWKVTTSLLALVQRWPRLDVLCNGLMLLITPHLGQKQNFFCKVLAPWVKVYIIVLVVRDLTTKIDRPGGEIGRHKGLKIPRTKHPCRFDPGPGHQYIKRCESIFFCIYSNLTTSIFT